MRLTGIFVVLLAVFIWGFEVRHLDIELLGAEQIVVPLYGVQEITHWNIGKKALLTSDARYCPTSFRWKPPDFNIPEPVPFELIAQRQGEDTFFRLPVFPDMEKQIHDGLLVIHIMAEEGLFEFEDGIYVAGFDGWKGVPGRPWWEQPANYHRRGKKARVSGYVSFSLDSHKRYFPCKIAINGNATRAYPQKSLRILPDPKRGLTYFYLPLLADSAERFGSFILRNGGNDWDKAILRDAVTSLSFTHPSLPVQRSVPVVVYINGAYWGLHNLRDRYSNDNLKFMAEERNTEMYVLEYPFDNKDVETLSGTARDFVNRSTAGWAVGEIDPADFDRENWFHYLFVQTWVQNDDWLRGNVKMRLEGVEGGGYRWIFLLCDTDYGLGYFAQDAHTHDPFAKAMVDNGPVGILLRYTLQHREWKSAFREFGKRASAEAGRKLTTQLDLYAGAMRSEIKSHGLRWRRQTPEQWELELKTVASFCTQRHQTYQHKLNSL
jgi:hypothetical protein